MTEPLEPIVEGPIPYFSAPVIYYGHCPRRDYFTGKCMTPQAAEKMTRAHINAKHAAQMTEYVDDLVNAWHAGAGAGQQLHEFLGMTWREYGLWARTARIPDTWHPPRRSPDADEDH